jgi:hypothetical protein
MENREYTFIVEFSYHAKEEKFVVKFLDNNSYVLKISDLHKNLLTRKPDWESTRLSEDHSCLLVPVGKTKERTIPFHVIHSKGIPL